VLPNLLKDLCDNPELAKALSADLVQHLNEEDFEAILLQEPLDTSELDLLAEATKKNTCITSLKWQMQDKYDNDTTAFYKALSKLPNLRTCSVDCLLLAENEYSGIDCSGLVALVQKCRLWRVVG
jgi:hypothetical protein